MKKILLGWTMIIVVASGIATASLHAESTVAANAVVGIKVQPDLAPDSTSLKSIVDSITRDCKNNDEKAVAIYNYMQLTHYHRAYPYEPGGIPAIKEINNYGWSLCGGLHAVQSALWRELGWGWRFVGWRGHTTVEAQYDGRWHYLDVFLKFYAWMPDGKGGRTIAGEGDLNSDSQSLISKVYRMDKNRRVVYPKDNAVVMYGETANWRAQPFLTCGDTIKGVVSGLKTHNRIGPSEKWGNMNHATGDYSTKLNLAPGYSLTSTWDPIEDAWFWPVNKGAPRHTCGGHKDTRNSPGIGQILEPYVNSKPSRTYGNGILTFTPDFTDKECLKSFVSVNNVKVENKSLVPVKVGEPADVVFSFKTPYILTQAHGEAVGADKVEVSVDAGKTFKPVDISDFTKTIKGKMDVLVKVGIKESLSSLNVKAIVQNNPGALPYLSPGKNQITVSVEAPKTLGHNKLVVTYAYRLGARTKSLEELCLEGKEIAKQHDVKWDDTITYVQKTFMAKDLPATFDIECRTPKKKYPVYPRMEFIRREVLSPTSKPQPLPEGAAKARSGGKLMSLPNPFMVGTEFPEKREVDTVKIPLTYVQFVDIKGGIADKGYLRWPKVAAEKDSVLASVVFISGDLKDIPTKDVDSIRIHIPITEGHNRAPGKLGAVLLSQPIVPGKACDINNIGDFIGTVIVSRQPKDKIIYSPAKIFSIDVTDGIKDMQKNKKVFNGFGLRIIPDRNTDDGYTVRCEISPTEKIWLEVDTYKK